MNNTQNEIYKNQKLSGQSKQSYSPVDFKNNQIKISQDIFELLYTSENTTDAIQSILKLLGEANNVSRVYIFEDTEDHEFCCNTFEWCAKGINSEINNLRKVNYKKELFGGYLDNFNSNGIFFCSDITKLPEVQYEMLNKQGIVSMLLCEIIVQDEIKGFIGFDDCKKNVEWTEEQKQCLHFVSKIIGTSLCKMRREEAFQEANIKLQHGLEQLKNDYKKLQKKEELFQLIIDKTSVSIWEYDTQNKTIIKTEFSKNAKGFETKISNVPENLIECGYVAPDSAEDYRDIYRRLSLGEQQVESIVRVQTADRKGWRFEKIQYINMFNEYGKPYKAVAISYDVTSEKADQDKMRRIIDSVPGGIGIFEIVNAQVHMLYLNNGFYELLGNSRESRKQFNGSNFWDAIHPEELEHVKASVKQLIAGKNSIDFRYRVVNMNGSYTWLRLIGNKFVDTYGRAYIYCSFVNIDEYMHALLELQKKQTIIDISMKNSKISTWEFDVKNHRAILSEGAEKQYGVNKCVENVPESMIEKGYVHPQSVDNYRILFSGEFPNKKPLQYDIQIKSSNSDEYSWERYILVPVYNGYGELITALGTSVDITEQNKMLEFYRKQVQDLESLNVSGLIAKGRYNLTKNQVEYYHRENENAITHRNAENYDSALKLTAQTCVEQSDRQKIISLFDRKKLLKGFDSENTEVFIDYKRITQTGSIIWCRTQAKLYSDPISGNIICFIISSDINEQKVTQQMIDTVIRLDYDYMALLDCKTNSYIIYTNDSFKNSDITIFHTSNYEKQVRQYSEKYLEPEDIQQTIYNMSINHIKVMLETKERYSCYANLKEENGIACRKMFQFSYLDRASEKILITCVDITETHRIEQKKIKELQKAKDAVEKAISVKTQFFTRMSHDLRTPLNAVIGLTEIAKDELSDKKAIEKYIYSINSSGKFLLELVNEGLDLEKINENKMVLSPKPYTYAEFKNTICTIIEPLCSVKNITFNFGSNKTSYTVMMDHVRFEQIFINLLSNAVKYTPEGGKVEFLIQNNYCDNSILHCDFVIRDNGIGMSKEFQKKMFEPFAQEENRLVPQSVGTGLGLSIVKSLVELMNGSITVKSEEGIGTDFIVHLDMPIVDIVEKEKNIEETSKNYSLANKCILLIEDHPINTQIAKKLLEKKGMRVICASNGKDGFELFKNAEQGSFDAILMDINMPIMDGLESTAKIRSICRADAKTIPIIAMSANSFKEDVQKSIAFGMDEHLSKPIEPQELYSTLMKYIE